MDEGLERASARERSLAEVLAVVGLSAGLAIGPSTPRVIYFSAKDLGVREGSHFDHTDDIEQALRWILRLDEGCWSVVFWKELDKEDYWVTEGKFAFIHLVIRDCPVREACLATGIDLGGAVCEAVHGYWAGLLESVFARKVDIFTGHAGFGSCLLRLRTTSS
jgi:predicted hydrocarbon binding protein